LPDSSEIPCSFPVIREFGRGDRFAADYPIVAIWRGALDGDDAALAAVALDAGPSRMLVERRATGTEPSTKLRGASRRR
jgi:hypothetical protein